MIKIAPSILSADFANLGQEIQKIDRGGCDYIHIDVMDGHYVPNITLGPLVIGAIRKYTDKVFDVHLMIEKPERYIKEFVEAGADLINVHQEATTHLHRTLQLIRSYGVKTGVTLNPATPISTLEHVLADVDMVLLMTVNPGFGGQSFIPGMYKKIADLKALREEKGYDFEIQVDGGVSLENVKQVVEAGADVLVAGSAIFGAEDVEQRIAEFRAAIEAIS